MRARSRLRAKRRRSAASSITCRSAPRSESSLRRGVCDSGSSATSADAHGGWWTEFRLPPKTGVANLDAQARRGACPPKVSSPCTPSANHLALAIFAGLLERNTADRTEEPMAGVIADLKAQ